MRNLWVVRFHLPKPFPYPRVCTDCVSGYSPRHLLGNGWIWFPVCHWQRIPWLLSCWKVVALVLQSWQSPVLRHDIGLSWKKWAPRHFRRLSVSSGQCTSLRQVNLGSRYVYPGGILPLPVHTIEGMYHYLRKWTGWRSGHMCLGSSWHELWLRNVRYDYDHPSFVLPYLPERRTGKQRWQLWRRCGNPSSSEVNPTGREPRNRSR